MNAESGAPSAWAMLEADSEVGHLLHDNLRIASGIQTLPYKDGVAILGGAVAELYGGYGLRGVLSKVLPLLDGSRTVEDVTRDCEGVSDRQVKEVVGNLFMSGLLRTGSASDLVTEADIYFDRLVGSTGVHRSGSDAVRQLHNSRIGVYATKEIASWLCGLFKEMEGGAAIEVVGPNDLDSDMDFLIVISVATNHDPHLVFEHANRIGIPALNVEVSGSNSRIGPFILPQVSASYACYVAAHARMIDQRDKRDRYSERLWASAALHLAVSILTRIVKRPPLNAFTDSLWKSGRQIEKRTTIARLHGWDEQGAAYRLPLNGDSPGYEGWKQYCGIALQTPDWHPANSYLMHFKSENIMSMFERVPAIYSEQALHLPIDSLKEEAARIHPHLSLSSLSVLGTYCAGFGRRNGVAHRFAPTGGDQGSTVIMFLVRDVDGMAEGGYWFDSNSARYEKMAEFNVDEVMRWLGVSESSPATMISFANVMKVARKYGPFSINIGWYDSGVLLAYARSLCDAMGLETTDHPRPNAEYLMQRVGLPQSALIPTGVFEIVAGSKEQVVSGKSALLNVVEMMAARRAIREWSTEEVSMGAVLQLCRIADNALTRHRHVAGFEFDLSLLLLLKLIDGEDGFYEYRCGQTPKLMTAYRREHHHNTLSQVRLTEAPVIVLPRIDLSKAFDVLGDAGVESAYRAAGAVVGEIWLNAAYMGFGGTACGGAFEGQIRSVTGRHGFEDFSPLSLCLGPFESADPNFEQSKGSTA